MLAKADRDKPAQHLGTGVWSGVHLSRKLSAQYGSAQSVPQGTGLPKHMHSIVVCLLLCCCVPRSSLTAGSGFSIGSAKLKPFLLSDVKLHDDTYQARAAGLNTQYLMSLEPDKLLWSFRKNAGLPTGSMEPFWGTWEDPGCDLRGHFVGHYLSALAFVAMNTAKHSAVGRQYGMRMPAQDLLMCQAAADRLQLIVSELRKCQDKLEGGYLSAFPSKLFDRLDGLLGVWAPYYTIHKVMAGLLDAYNMAGSQLALTMVKDMAAYFLGRIDRTIKTNGTEHWHRMLDVEFGGMNDVLYRLYRTTSDPEHLRIAHMFDKPSFYNPLVKRQDILPGHHANTHLAQVIGFAERYEAVGDVEAADVVSFFFDTLTTSHSYATGGSNAKEFWSTPSDMATSVLDRRTSLETHEICTQYNVLKIARSLFGWTADVRLADFYERALVNGILGVSRMTSDDVQEPSPFLASSTSRSSTAASSGSTAASNSVVTQTAVSTTSSLTGMGDAGAGSGAAGATASSHRASSSTATTSASAGITVSDLAAAAIGGGIVRGRQDSGGVTASSVSGSSTSVGPGGGAAVGSRFKGDAESGSNSAFGLVSDKHHHHHQLLKGRLGSSDLPSHFHRRHAHQHRRKAAAARTAARRHAQQHARHMASDMLETEPDAEKERVAGRADLPTGSVTATAAAAAAIVAGHTGKNVGGSSSILSSLDSHDSISDEGIGSGSSLGSAGSSSGSSGIGSKSNGWKRSSRGARTSTRRNRLLLTVVEALSSSSNTALLSSQGLHTAQKGHGPEGGNAAWELEHGSSSVGGHSHAHGHSHEHLKSHAHGSAGHQHADASHSQDQIHSHDQHLDSDGQNRATKGKSGAQQGSVKTTSHRMQTAGAVTRPKSDAHQLHLMEQLAMAHSVGIRPAGRSQQVEIHKDDAEFSSSNRMLLVTDRNGLATGGAGSIVGSGKDAAQQPLHVRPYNKDFFPYWGFDIKQIPGASNATNVAGTPGVFLYLLPMGAGQSKGDNLHHWGYPYHSFWCCYGTAIEAFAKLADSIWFWAPAPAPAAAMSAVSSAPAGPTLYVTQLVSSTLTWREINTTITMLASMFEPGSSARAQLTISTAQVAPIPFTLKLRVPGWAAPGTVRVLLNGQDWRACPGPGPPHPGSFCALERAWISGDVVELHCGLSLSLSALPDPAKQYTWLQAIMWGPYVMAGLTHDTRTLTLPPATAAAMSTASTSRGAATSGMTHKQQRRRLTAAELLPSLTAAVSEPGDVEELVSLAVGWNASVFLRHDMYHVYTSVISDSGDAIDGTFRLLHGCQSTNSGLINQHHAGAQAQTAGGDGSVAGKGSSGSSAGIDPHQRHHMKLGQHDDITISLEAMSMPGFFLRADEAGVMVLQQLGSSSSSGGGGSGTSNGLEEGHSDAWCAAHTYLLRPGLDGAEQTISLESVTQPGSFITTYPANPAPACTDTADAAWCAEEGKAKSGCLSAPEVFGVRCRQSCGTCNGMFGALTLQRRVLNNDAFAAASSFSMTAPLTPRYPPGSKVVTGINRKYLIAPLGSLIDERYTVYFQME